MRQTNGGMHIGSATLVMLFSVLCLTIFATASVVSANNAWLMAEKSANAVTAYYQAECTAIDMLQQITVTETGVLSHPGTYWVDIDDHQRLAVEVEAIDGTVVVVCWEVEASDTWQADQTLTLWEG